jgi:hypothetical protein
MLRPATWLGVTAAGAAASKRFIAACREEDWWFRKTPEVQK